MNMRSFLVLFSLPLLSLLGAGNCGPGTGGGDEPGCELSCEFGYKHDTAGNEFCECRASDTCSRQLARPQMDPATGECHGFSTVCDYPSGWVPCGACEADECGPAPGMPNQVCIDGVNMSGPAGCDRQADGTCSWTIASCPDYAFCGGIAGFACADGEDCIDNPADNCDPENGGADCGGICVPQACGSRNLPQCPDEFICQRRLGASCGPEADCGGVCVVPQSCGGHTAQPQTCPAGKICVDNPNNCGLAADCTGICIDDNTSPSAE